MAVSTASDQPQPHHERDAALKRETIRNRNNQRAFRSRRQDYIRGLEEQVRNFQREGIKATQEVQIAARSVAVENTLLRKLLKAYAQFSDQKIDALLVHMREEGADISWPSRIYAGASAPAHSGFEPIAPSSSDKSLAIERSNSPRELTSANGTTPSRSMEVRTTQSLSDSPHPQSLVELVPMIKSTPSRDQIPPSTVCEQTDVIQTTILTDSEPQVSRSSCSTTRDSMSCEEAAAIIAGLRMRNTEEAREELGCRSQEPCHIENISLLQLMNETF